MHTHLNNTCETVGDHINIGKLDISFKTDLQDGD